MSQLSLIAKNTAALIMAGGRGSRLGELTSIRSKPAVYFGGKFRIIDFTLSNCVNSGIKKIAILTQYKAHSLLRHLQTGWSFLKPEMGEYMEFLPASQMKDENMWYRGTADSIAQNLTILQGYPVKYFIILAGDHIYKMDYSKMVEFHIQNKAEVTVACIRIPKQGAEEFGVMGIDNNFRINAFVEKSKTPPTLPNNENECLGSMGIYVFDKEKLFEILKNDFDDQHSSHDFGKDIIPACVSRGKAYAFPFDNACIKNHPDAKSYWKDVGTIEAFWQANIDLTQPIDDLDIYDKTWPILTHQQQLPPAKFLYNNEQERRKGAAVDSLVAGGCIISGAQINRCVLFSEVKVNSFAEVSESILFPNVDIGRYCKIQKTIIEKHCKIPPNTIIGYNRVDDEKRFSVSKDGIVVVTEKHIEDLDLQ